MALFPIVPAPSSVSLTAIFQSSISYAQDGSRYLRGAGGHRWAIEAVWDNLDTEEFKPVQAFIDKQYGRYGTFTFAPPELATPRGTALGSPLVDGGAQTGKTLTVKGCTPNQRIFLDKGDVFTLAGDTKMYMLTVGVFVGGSGQAILKFRPSLRTSPADNAVITIHDVALTVGLVENSNLHNAHTPVLYNQSVGMLEVI